MLETANADPPPPDGSTAMGWAGGRERGGGEERGRGGKRSAPASTKWRVLYRDNSSVRSNCSFTRGLCRNESTSLEGKALLEPSLAMPIDSRSSIAGSSCEHRAREAPRQHARAQQGSSACAHRQQRFDDFQFRRGEPTGHLGEFVSACVYNVGVSVARHRGRRSHIFQGGPFACNLRRPR